VVTTFLAHRKDIFDSLLADMSYRDQWRKSWGKINKNSLEQSRTPCESCETIRIIRIQDAPSSSLEFLRTLPRKCSFSWKVVPQSINKHVKTRDYKHICSSSQTGSKNLKFAFSQFHQNMQFFFLSLSILWH
jgi:hypothetical protein